jgi:hypothetical protein
MLIVHAPTLKLLNSSTVVAISAVFRLHIAFLLAGIATRFLPYIAFGLIMYATYTLDRALECKEDAINKSELCGANRKIGLAACTLTFLAGTVLLFLDGIYLAPFVPFVIGYFYSKGFRLGPVVATRRLFPHFRGMPCCRIIMVLKILMVLKSPDG